MSIAEKELTENGPLQREARAPAAMKALVHHGPGKRAWEAKPRPTITDAADAIVRITTSTICGADLHMLKGDLPAVTDVRILGHEGIGIVENVGPSVISFRVGDSVLSSCITAWDVSRVL
jgi:alcohol dehydrogenase